MLNGKLVNVKSINFFYDVNRFVLIQITNDIQIESIEKQYHLFDYMNELKLDYRGLIDANLSVSVHDLPENPYK